MRPPFPHQWQGSAFALTRPTSLLAHDMGTGKTRTAIMAADQAHVKRILIVCPTIATGVWRDQFQQWSKTPRPMQLIRNGKDKPFTVTPCITVVGYDLLSRSKPLVALLMEQTYDLIIIDEAHCLKERTSRRTKAMYGSQCRGNGIVSRSERIILLTGTPMLNHPGELWTHLRALYPTALPGRPDFQTFVDTYCDTTSRWIGQRLIERIVGAKRGAMPALREKIAPWMQRVRKEDVLKDLPPLLWTVWPVTLQDCQPAEHAETVKRYRVEEEQAWKDLGNARSDDEILAFLKSSEHMATQRRLCGELKVYAAIKAIREELEYTNGKVVVFAHHTSVIDLLAGNLGEFGVRILDGRTPAKKRDEYVQLFQENDDIRVFIGQNNAATTAITLTASSSVWIVEPDWTPAINAQAASRCHRAGQLSSVDVRVVALEGSIDQAIATVLARKAESIAALIEGEV